MMKIGRKIYLLAKTELMFSYRIRIERISDRRSVFSGKAPPGELVSYLFFDCWILISDNTKNDRCANFCRISDSDDYIEPWILEITAIKSRKEITKGENSPNH